MSGTFTSPSAVRAPITTPAAPASFAAAMSPTGTNHIQGLPIEWYARPRAAVLSSGRREQGWRVAEGTFLQLASLPNITAASSSLNRKSPPRGRIMTCTATVQPTAATTCRIIPIDGVVPPSTSAAQSSTASGTKTRGHDPALPHPTLVSDFLTCSGLVLHLSLRPRPRPSVQKRRSRCTPRDRWSCSLERERRHRAVCASRPPSFALVAAPLLAAPTP